MKIKLSEIGPAGLQIEDGIDLAALNQRMQEGHSTDITFTRQPVARVMVERTPQGAQLKGTISTVVKQACSRCPQEVERELEVGIDYILQHVTPELRAEGEPLVDDVGIIFFEGDQLDLEPALQEALILPLSPFWQPPHRPDGSCQYCGLKGIGAVHTENVTSNLGELLKRAGVRK